MAIPRNLTLEQAQNLHRDRQIEALQQQLGIVLNLLEGGGIRVNREDEVLSERNSDHHDSSHGSERAYGSSTDSNVSSQPRRRNKKHKDDLRDIKVDPPDFVGSLNPDEYFEWVQTMDKIIEVKGYDEKKGFKVAVMKLKKYASLWYENMKHERELEGKKRVNTWSKLKECMLKKICSSSLQTRFVY